MEARNYIIGKLVPELLRQKIIDIEGSDETEFINIDSVDVKQLSEAFALSNPYAVDVQLSRYCERDVKHKFNLVVKVSEGVLSDSKLKCMSLDNISRFIWNCAVRKVTNIVKWQAAAKRGNEICTITGI